MLLLINSLSVSVQLNYESLQYQIRLLRYLTPRVDLQAAVSTTPQSHAPSYQADPSTSPCTVTLPIRTVLFSVGTTSGAELGVLSYVILTGLIPTCLAEGLGVDGETCPSWFSRGHSTGGTITTLALVEVASTVLAEYMLHTYSKCTHMYSTEQVRM